MSKKVLIIDDDDHIRMLYSYYLEDYGFEVHTARNGKEGLSLFEQQCADVVVLDVLMPEEDGVETIQSLREMQPDVGIIAISGGGRISAPRYLEIMRLLGAHYVLEKPVDIEHLLGAVISLAKSPSITSLEDGYDRDASQPERTP